MVPDLARSNLEEPSKVLPVEMLLSDIRALKKLTAPVVPPQVKLRAREVLQVLYLPGNASGEGFGYAVIGGKLIMYESGNGTLTGRRNHQTSGKRITL